MWRPKAHRHTKKVSAYRRLAKFDLFMDKAVDCILFAGSNCRNVAAMTVEKLFYHLFSKCLPAPKYCFHALMPSMLLLTYEPLQSPFFEFNKKFRVHALLFNKTITRHFYVVWRPKAHRYTKEVAASNGLSQTREIWSVYGWGYRSYSSPDEIAAMLLRW